MPPSLLAKPFAVRDAVRLGIPEDRLRGADLWRPTHGVRMLDPPLDLVERARAFAAASRSPFAFSHVTAAQLLGILVSEEMETDCLLHIVRATTSNRMRRDEVRGHRGLEWRRSILLDGVPVVEPCDTWVDLGEMVGGGKPAGLDDLIAAGDAVANLARGVKPLKQAIERRVRPRGKITLTYAVPRIRVGSASAMESRARLMIVRAGLPEPSLNQHVVSDFGEWLGCADLVWRAERVVGEYQGVRWHSSLEQQAADEVRFARFRRNGWAVVPIVSDDVFEKNHRDAKLIELAEALGADPQTLALGEAAPQFLAPQQFRRPRRR
ncbi:hypothetical protein GCM10009740_07380 [Terrabacter terrae]|uniref:DUF559 domain-containing protein n=1 Tax=Terrabacter terrae TaxID=318434 RepID=A0ABN2TTP5_9MICO